MSKTYEEHLTAEQKVDTWVAKDVDTIAYEIMDFIREARYPDTLRQSVIYTGKFDSENQLTEQIYEATLKLLKIESVVDESVDSLELFLRPYGLVFQFKDTKTEYDAEIKSIMSAPKKVKLSGVSMEITMSKRKQDQ